MIENRNATAWASMFAALTLHVADEATTGFLPFYNGLVEDFRARLGFFPMPTFTFPAWITGLTLLVLGGFLAVPRVARGGRLLQAIAFSFGLLMIGNGIGHLLGSLYFGWLIPGSRSAPVLLAAAVWLVARAVGGDWSARATPSPSASEAP